MSIEYPGGQSDIGSQSGASTLPIGRCWMPSPRTMLCAASTYAAESHAEKWGQRRVAQANRLQTARQTAGRIHWRHALPLARAVGGACPWIGWVTSRRQRETQCFAKARQGLRADLRYARLGESEDRRDLV